MGVGMRAREACAGEPCDISDRVTIPFLPTREIYLEICHWNETHSRATPYIYTPHCTGYASEYMRGSEWEHVYTPDAESRPARPSPH